MATEETITLNPPHAPHPNAIEAFSAVLHTIKAEIIKSRHDWNIHERRMWSRASHLSDAELTAFNLSTDLAEIRSAVTSYGTIIFGKIRIPATKDELGEGFIHVRIHDPPNRGTEDVIFHSLFTDEKVWRAIQTEGTPLEFFNE